MANLSDNFDYYKDNEIIIDDFDYEYDDDAQDTYEEHGDGGNPEVRSITQSHTFKVGQYSTRFPITHSSGSSAWSGSLESLDVSRFTGVDSGTPTEGKIKCVITRSSTSNISAISIRVGSDGSNFGEWTPTLPTVTVPATLEDNLSSLTLTGNPDWTNVDYVEILVTSSGGSPYVELSGLRFTHDSRLTRGIWEEGNAQMNTANADSIFYLAKRQQELTLLHPDAADANSEIINEFADRVLDNTFTIISKFRWRRDGASNREIGVAFHISDTTEASQDCYVAYIDESDNQVNFDKFVGGTQTNIDSKSFTPSTNTDYYLKVENDNGTFTISVSEDGGDKYTTYVKIADATFTTGTVGTYTKGNPVAEFFEFYAFNLPYVRFDNWSFHARDMITVVDVQEDSGPQLDLKTANIALADKNAFIHKNWKSKFINVRGNINTSTVRDLTNTIDDIKEHAGREEKLLRIGKESGNTGIFEERSYSANAINLDRALKREHWHKTFMPFNITFEALDGTAQDRNTINLRQFSWDEYTFTKSYTFKGTAPPLPVITFVLTDATPASGSINTIDLYNQTTNQTITVESDSTYSDEDRVTIDFRTGIVDINGTPQSYTGKIGTDFFVPGLNRITYTIDTTTNEHLAVTGGTDKRFKVHQNRERAMQFETTSTSTFNRVSLLIGLVEAPSEGNVTLEIQTDSGANLPTNTLVNAGATDSIDAANLPVDPNYSWTVFRLDTAASLTSGTKYWIVLKYPNGTLFDGGSGVRWIISTSDIYADGGNSARDPLGTAVWDAINANKDHMFKLYESGPTNISGTLDVSYKPRYL